MFKALVDKVISIGHTTQELKAGELYVESAFTKTFPSFFEKAEGVVETVKTKVEEAVEEIKETVTEKFVEKGEEILKDESSEVKAAEEKVEEAVEETKGRKGRK
jgi:DNA anti-recombination protein RmuC